MGDIEPEFSSNIPCHGRSYCGGVVRMCFGFFSSQTDGTVANYVLLSEGNFSRSGIFLGDNYDHQSLLTRGIPALSSE